MDLVSSPAVLGCRGRSSNRLHNIARMSERENASAPFGAKQGAASKYARKYVARFPQWHAMGGQW